MAKLRPKALDCPSCGASIEVRNAVRAKSVVCGTCTAQIDLTKPGFEILGKLGAGREPPTGPIRLGMHANVGGKEHEVIGRLRLRESDDEETWFWDEWLMVSEDGSYRWLSEDPEKGWGIDEPFVPETPVTPADLVEGNRVRIGDKRVLVRERGRGEIAHIEGEMTWRARVGDRVDYADATLGLHGYAFEWTDDEFESFTTREVSRPELWAMFGLGRSQPEATAHHERSQALRRSATVLFVAALLAFGVALVAPFLGSPVSRSDGGVSLKAADVQHGIQLGEVQLEKGLGFYVFEAAAYMPRGMESYDIELEGPGSSKATIVRFQHVGTSHDRESATERFTVSEPGVYRIVLRGQEKTPAQDGQVEWRLHRRLLVPRWFVLAGIALVVLSLWTFFQSRKEAMIASSLYYGEEGA